jgi:hypothetical protein
MADSGQTFVLYYYYRFEYYFQTDDMTVVLYFVDLCIGVSGGSDSGLLIRL